MLDAWIMTHKRGLQGGVIFDGKSIRNILAKIYVPITLYRRKSDKTTLNRIRSSVRSTFFSFCRNLAKKRSVETLHQIYICLGCTFRSRMNARTIYGKTWRNFQSKDSWVLYSFLGISIGSKFSPSKFIHTWMKNVFSKPPILRVKVARRSSKP